MLQFIQQNQIAVHLVSDVVRIFILIKLIFFFSINVIFFTAAANDKVIRKNLNIDTNDRKMRCKFGKLRLFIGDELNVDTEETNSKCTCIHPPLAQCVSIPLPED